MTTKPPEEIQRAHDLLLGIILEEVPNPGVDMDFLRIAAGVLCWVLNHDHNQTFNADLKRIEQALSAAGYVLQDHGN